ncbi:hypothetical protein T4B_14417 [Trichinella pseudospiralis]|uniref:Uncharacterized protein n=2 Tax=Trichinella pseudospiralis TaxID=6337 RepID=A0A0V1J609_TRIPS|nr:hypothetical protein T4D_7785 [Trichinella pseudospiralis]KRZ30401.1 hypothetical protein T4B_14417 [Trichinella pseudospiralis]
MDNGDAMLVLDKMHAYWFVGLVKTFHFNTSEMQSQFSQFSLRSPPYSKLSKMLHLTVTDIKINRCYKINIHGALVDQKKKVCLLLQFQNSGIGKV